MISKNDPKLASLNVAPSRLPRSLFTRGLPLATILAAAMPLGCIAGELTESDEGGEDEVAEVSDGLVATPATCQEIKNGSPGAPDGDYLLYVGHNALKP